MPALEPVAQTLKVVMNGTTTAGRNWAIITHWLYTGSAPSDGNCDGFAVNFMNAWVTEMIPLQCTDMSTASCQVTDLTSSSSGQGSYDHVVAGTRSGDVIPAGASMLAQYSQALRWRGGHPRQYLPVGVTTDLLNTSEWTAGFTTTCATAWSAVLGTFTGATQGGTTISQQGMASYRSGRVDRVPGLFVPITFSGCSEVVASQRKRTRRRA